MRAPLIALLTDFGTRDWYVAAVKGVILSRCSAARFLDISHEIPPQDVFAGAVTLTAVWPWLPPRTIVMAVVDPGVGTRRAMLAARADGRYLLGPDNGLLSLSLAKSRSVRIVRLTQRRYWLPSVSQTFQARDVMAPVAAYLARGGSLKALGVPASSVVTLAQPPVRTTQEALQGCVVHVDTFGNLITNISGAQLASMQRLGRVAFWCHRRRLRVVSSYAQARAGEVVAVIGSVGMVELARRNASAAAALGARRGDRVLMRRLRR